MSFCSYCYLSSHLPIQNSLCSSRKTEWIFTNLHKNFRFPDLLRKDVTSCRFLDRPHSGSTKLAYTIQILSCCFKSIDNHQLYAVLGRLVCVQPRLLELLLGRDVENLHTIRLALLQDELAVTIFIDIFVYASHKCLLPIIRPLLRACYKIS